jgi:hypothetical protein
MLTLPDMTTGRNNAYRFGEYEGIELEGSFVKLKDEKMENALNRLQGDTWHKDIVEVRNYFKVAKILAEKIIKNEELTDEDIKAFKIVCLITAGDEKIPKGSIAVATFMYAMENRLFKGGGKKGRSILTEKQKEKAEKDYFENGKSASKIAREMKVSRDVLTRIGLIKANKKLRKEASLNGDNNN